jgi:hypothetical protein
METIRTYENYPAWILILSNIVSLATYASGFIIMYQTGLIIAALYLIFIFALEYRLISRHCIECYYWGKTCGFGRSRISSLFFKKGESSEFCKLTITWKYMIPDLLVSLIPFVTGIVLIIIRFDYLLLIAVVTLTTMTTSGNGFIRSKLTCKFCKQRELGCPADRLFNKEKNVSRL